MCVFGCKGLTGCVLMQRVNWVSSDAEREESMDIDVLQSSPPEDVDMSAAMKRNLSAEFDGQSASKGRRSGAVTPLSGAITPRSTMKRRRSVTGSSCRRSSRRTVHFVDASDSPACERLPVTPFNKNSRGKSCRIMRNITRFCNIFFFFFLIIFLFKMFASSIFLHTWVHFHNACLGPLLLPSTRSHACVVVSQVT